MQPPDYMQLVRGLPRPSPAQVEDFLAHLADADNWLKLLPLQGGPELSVYLDPSAGARLNRGRGSGRYAVEVLGADAELVHGSELPTDAYRRRFGFLTYHLRLGGGTAGEEGGVLLRALLPEPGIVHAGALVPLPAPLRALSCRPGAFLHGTFRGASGRGEKRRFRYAVERLAKAEAVRRDHPLVPRIREWVERCKEEDRRAFGAWVRSVPGESDTALDETARWQRYVAWRDDDACMRLHEAQDAAFEATGIPAAVVREHERAVDLVRQSVRRLLAALAQI